MTVDAVNVVRKRRKGYEVPFAHGVLFCAKLSSADAKLLMEANDAKQRGLRPRVVARYLRDMENDRFYPIMPLVITDAGNVIDGQHRLTALSQWPNGEIEFSIFLVKEGKAEKKIRASIDIGVVRTAVDVGRIVGLDVPPSLIRAYSLENGNGRSSAVLTRSEIPGLIEHDKIAMAVAPFFAKHKKVKIPALAAFLRCARINREAAEMFFGAVFSQVPTVNRKYNVTANTLSHYLAEVHHGTAEDRKNVFAKCLVAWNAWRNDENLERIAYRGVSPPQAV
jgi:hypothetical protein